MITPADIVDDVAADLPLFVTPDEFAALFKYSRRHTYRLLASGELTAIQGRPRGPLRIPRAVVLDFVARLAGA